MLHKELERSQSANRELASQCIDILKSKESQGLDLKHIEDKLLSLSQLSEKQNYFQDPKMPSMYLSTGQILNAKDREVNQLGSDAVQNQLTFTYFEEQKDSPEQSKTFSKVAQTTGSGSYQTR